MFNELVYKITGRKHHFKVKVTYTPDPKNGSTFVGHVFNLETIDVSEIINDRMIKKLVADEIIGFTPKYLRKNGIMQVAEVYYLGWFKKKGE